MKYAATILACLLAACACRAGDYRTFTLTMNAQTSAIPVTGYADPFTGDIDEISVYTPSGVTGAVVIEALDPYSGDALVLCTNATVTGRMVWRPRLSAPEIEGSTALTVTNAASGDRFRVQGERIRATVSDATKTSAVFRVFLKIK